MAFKLNFISIKKKHFDTDAVKTLRVRAKVLLPVWPYDFL